MSQATLPSASLYSSPGFPQALDVVVTGIDRIIQNLALHQVLGRCEHVDRVCFGATGENDVEFQCMADAKVHDLASDQQFCFAHFLKAVIR